MPQAIPTKLNVAMERGKLLKVIFGKCRVIFGVLCERGMDLKKSINVKLIGLLKKGEKGKKKFCSETIKKCETLKDKCSFMFKQS